MVRSLPSVTQQNKILNLRNDLAFLFAISALAVILGLAYWDWRQFQAATERVRDTERSLELVEGVLSTVKDGETGQRGFLISGDEVYLNPYNKAKQDFPREFAQMHAAPLWRSKSRHDVLVKLEGTVHDKFDEMQQLIDIRRSRGAEPAFDELKEGRGRRMMQEIRTSCLQLEESLRTQLDRRTRVAETQTRQARLISVGASCLLFILVALATLKFKAEKDAAQSANQVKSLFLANMSHELRTPLNAIIGYSEMLLEEAEDSGHPGLVPDVHKILAAGKHLLELINAILDLSKIEAGKMEVYLETFNVPALVEEVISVIKPLVEKNGNTIRFTVDPLVQTMRSDQTKLRQTLFNLLSNASKFTSGGFIDVAVSTVPEARIAFAVTDTGVGMTPEQMSRLFEPFTQGDASTSRKYGGTGLGLVISRRFARMLGGDIAVISVPAKGSTFTLTLPQTAQSSAAKADAVVSAPTSNGNTAGTILVIDDEPDVHEILARTLTKQGFQIERAFTGEEGLRLARAIKPRIITLDVMMPGLDGWSVLAALKSDPELAAIPVIMITIADNKNLGYALGAADYLTKPIDRERLAAVLLRYRNAANNTALVVEDDPSSREHFLRLLTGDGWTVAQAANGIEALEQLRRQRPNVVLLDLMMPEMDGFEFVAEMHRHAEWKEIPVVVITARDLSSEDRARLNGHVSRVLQKGLYTRDELLAQVSALVESRISGKTLS